MADHNQYGLPELRQLLAGRSNLEGTQQAIFDPFFVKTRTLAPPPPPPLHEPISHFDSSNINKIGQICSNNNYYCTTNNNNNVGFGSDNYSSISTGTSSRWRRQETLTLLEIRSRLDPRFKEANKKGPLWDEVSRIMAKEFRYQRSGKKCREKFENLYKYYKKTKDGKAGRQDGKHYRFFRQLEAIYGGNIKQGTGHDQSLSSFTNTTTTTSELETSSSENNVFDDGLSVIACMMDRSKGKRVEGGEKRGCKVNVKDYVELRIGEMMETQEFWMERVMKSVEERKYRQEEWMKREKDRLDWEYESWSKGRACMEARGATVIDALKVHAENNINYNNNYNNVVASQGYMSSQVQGRFDHGQGEVNFWDKNELKVGIEERDLM